MKKYKYTILSLIILLFVFNIKIVISSTMSASILFFNKIFINIFPFIILCDILLYYDYHIFLNNIFGNLFFKLFKIPKISSIVLILSIFTSSPTNAIYINELLDNNIINEKEANIILTQTYFPSFAFVTGFIGFNIFNSFKIGLLLWIFIIINNILIGLYLKKDIKNHNNNYKIIKEDNLIITIKKSIIKAFNTSFIILGNLIIFTIIINIIENTFNINNVLLTTISGLIEITNGINRLNALNISFNSKLSLTYFLLSFNGLSIIFQSYTILSKYKINIKKILITKLVFSIITTIIIYYIMHSLFFNV